MPSPYIQLLLVNMLLAVLTSIVVLGAPVLPAVVGAAGGGALLYAVYRRRNRRSPASATQAPDLKDSRGRIDNRVRQWGRGEVAVTPDPVAPGGLDRAQSDVAPAPTAALRRAETAP